MDNHRKIDGQEAVDIIVKLIGEFGFSKIKPFMVKQHLSSYAQMLAPITESASLFAQMVFEDLALLLEDKGIEARYADCFEAMKYFFIEPEMNRVSRFIKRHSHIITLMVSVTIPVMIAILTKGS